MRCRRRCCPQQITFNDVQFRTRRRRRPARPMRSSPRARRSNLPAGHYNRVYVLAASADGDQKAIFQVGKANVSLNIQDWGGFIGQWDDRQWSSSDTSKDDYGEMTGIKPGYIKRADLAWYCSHHHNCCGRERVLPLFLSVRVSRSSCPPAQEPSSCRTTTRFAFWPSPWRRRIRR